MPKRPSCLMKRGSTYYVRKPIPTDIRSVHPKGKNGCITYSLGTSDYKKACKRLNIELVKIDSEFDKIRQQNYHEKKSKARKVRLCELTESQREAIVLRWYQEQETEIKQELTKLNSYEPEEIPEIKEKWIDSIREEDSSVMQELDLHDYQDGSKLELGKDAVREKLKDPDSAQFKDVFFHRGKTGAPITCGKVNAKNSFGGYGAFQYFVSAGKPELTYLQSEVVDFQTVWKGLCVD